MPNWKRAINTLSVQRPQPHNIVGFPSPPLSWQALATIFVMRSHCHGVMASAPKVKYSTCCCCFSCLAVAFCSSCCFPCFCRIALHKPKLAILRKYNAQFNQWDIIINNYFRSQSSTWCNNSQISMVLCTNIYLQTVFCLPRQDVTVGSVILGVTAVKVYISTCIPTRVVGTCFCGEAREADSNLPIWVNFKVFSFVMTCNNKKDGAIFGCHITHFLCHNPVPLILQIPIFRNIWI